MTDLVTCDFCGTAFSVRTAGIRTTRSGDYEVQYFTCPGCHHRYQVLTTDTALRQSVQRHRRLSTIVKLSKAKEFPAGCAQKVSVRNRKVGS